MRSTRLRIRYLDRSTESIASEHITTGQALLIVSVNCIDSSIHFTESVRSTSASGKLRSHYTLTYLLVLLAKGLPKSFMNYI